MRMRSHVRCFAHACAPAHFSDTLDVRIRAEMTGWTMIEAGYVNRYRTLPAPFGLTSFRNRNFETHRLRTEVVLNPDPSPAGLGWSPHPPPPTPYFCICIRFSWRAAVHRRDSYQLTFLRSRTLRASWYSRGHLIKQIRRRDCSIRSRFSSVVDRL